jgi:protein-tyrosine phosphatase
LKKRFSILFVCTGNTCRSPLAEIMMRNELRRAGIKHVSVSSAGTAAADGGRASQNAKVTAEQMALSLARFRSKPLTARRVKGADLILTMGRAQQGEITGRWPEAAEKTHVISEFSGSGRGDIDDPMGKSGQAYRHCADVLADEIKRVLQRLRRLLKRKGKLV